MDVVVADSQTWSEVVEKFGLKPYRGSNAHLKKRADELGIDYSHFPGQSWSRGRKFSRKTELSKLLIKDSKVKSYRIRDRLIEEGLKQPECEWCGQSRWHDWNIPLELDHMNGDPSDNRLKNLQILCPNCHSLITKLRRSGGIRHTH